MQKCMAMKKHQIESLIRGYVRKNFIHEPKVFPSDLMNILKLAKELANGYWEHRTMHEIDRDAEVNVTLDDYYIWVAGEMTLIKHQMLYN